MVDPTFCIGNLWCGLTVAHILLWVLTFAITYGILEVLGVFGKDKDGKITKTARKVNAIVAVVMAFFILMAVPATTISVISSMSNSFVGLAIAVIILMALLSIAGVTMGDTVKKAMAVILGLITIVVFVGAGGLGIIGVNAIPAFGFGPEIWIVALVVIAVIWLAMDEKKA